MPIAKSTATLLLWSLIQAGAAAGSGGSIVGAVVDEKGAPIGNARVLYRSIPNRITAPDGRRVSTGPSVGSTGRTAADGTFAFASLQPGTYNVCAYGPKLSDLDTCQWGQQPGTVTLADGQIARLQLTIAEGTLLTFQVEDPKHRVVDLESLPRIGGRLPLTGANFAVGAWAGTRYLRAALLSVAGATRRYQVAVPKTTTVRLFLDTLLDVKDNAGLTLPGRRPSTSIGAGGQPEVIVNLVIP
jgi:hypothetical protein